MRAKNGPKARHGWRQIRKRLENRSSKTARLTPVEQGEPGDGWPLHRSAEQKNIDLLLTLSAQSMRDSGRWCDLPYAQSIVMQTGSEAHLSIAAEAMPPALATIDDHGVVRPRVRGLIRSHAGKSLVSRFPDAIEVACSRARAGRPTVSMRRLRRQLALGRIDARQLAAVLDAEGNCFVPRRWRRTRPWRIGRSWDVQPSIDLYSDIETVRQYLAIQDSHPVIARGRSVSSREAHPDSQPRSRQLIMWFASILAAPLAVGVATPFVISAIKHTSRDLAGAQCRSAGRQVARSTLPLPRPLPSAELSLMRSAICQTVWATLAGAPPDAFIRLDAVGSTRTASARFSTKSGRLQRSQALSTPTIASDDHCAVGIAVIDWRGRVIRAHTECR